MGREATGSRRSRGLHWAGQPVTSCREGPARLLAPVVWEAGPPLLGGL